MLRRLLFVVILSKVGAFISPLQGIVSGQALIYSLTRNIGNEIVAGNFLLNDAFRGSIHLNTDIFYLGLLGLSLFNKHQTNKIIDKFENLETFIISKRAFNVVFLVIMIVLTKNVDNAI